MPDSKHPVAEQKGPLESASAADHDEQTPASVIEDLSLDEESDDGVDPYNSAVHFVADRFKKD